MRDTEGHFYNMCCSAAEPWKVLLSWESVPKYWGGVADSDDKSLHKWTLSHCCYEKYCRVHIPLEKTSSHEWKHPCGCYMHLFFYHKSLYTKERKKKKRSNVNQRYMSSQLLLFLAHAQCRKQWWARTNWGVAACPEQNLWQKFWLSCHPSTNSHLCAVSMC